LVEQVCQEIGRGVQAGGRGFARGVAIAADQLRSQALQGSRHTGWTGGLFGEEMQIASLSHQVGQEGGLAHTGLAIQQPDAAFLLAYPGRSLGIRVR